MKSPRLGEESWRARAALSALALLLVHGCGGDGDKVGVPQPEPLALKMRNGPMGKESEPREVLLLGMPGSVAGAGEVAVQTKQGERSTGSTAAGSFALQIVAGPDEEVSVRYEDSGAAPYTVAAVSCPVSGCAPRPAPGPRTGLEPITAPVAGKTTIQGEVTGPADAVAVNLRSGAVATATPATDSGFRVELAAQSGDAVEVFSDGKPMSASWKLTVP
jgi:hypothetical protein